MLRLTHGKCKKADKCRVKKFSGAEKFDAHGQKKWHCEPREKKEGGRGAPRPLNHDYRRARPQAPHEASPAESPIPKPARFPSCTPWPTERAGRQQVHGGGISNDPRQ